MLTLLLSGGSLVAVAVQAARPVETGAPTALRVLTYNIQQGYNAAGERAYQEQLEVLQALSPDVMGLQESDTARIDHIFVSPSVAIGEVSYLPTPASDHPPLVAAVHCPAEK